MPPHPDGGPYSGLLLYFLSAALLGLLTDKRLYLPQAGTQVIPGIPPKGHGFQTSPRIRAAWKVHKNTQGQARGGGTGFGPLSFSHVSQVTRGPTKFETHRFLEPQTYNTVA